MKNVQTHHSDVTFDLPPLFDRRRRERIALRIPLRVVSCGLLMERTDEATCTDLSEGGVAFETAAELNVGDIVLLEFRQKGDPTYRCHARLTYRMQRKYGAYFLGAV
jgi:hypothetical protein